jgi:hypothetical protein
MTGVSNATQAGNAKKAPRALGPSGAEGEHRHGGRRQPPCSPDILLVDARHSQRQDPGNEINSPPDRLSGAKDGPSAKMPAQMPEATALLLQGNDRDH